MPDVRLIDANALKKEMVEVEIVTQPYSHFISERVVFGYDIDDAPTIDAVEVVRCRECKYLIAPKLCSNPMACGWDALEPNDDDFCSRGEKKDGGAEC